MEFVEKEKKSKILNIQYSYFPKGKIQYIQYSIQGGTKRNKKNYTDKKAQQKAMYLADKLGNPGGMMFYLKCAWNLTDEYLDWLVGYSMKKSNPARYFSSVASKEMKKNLV